MCRLAWNLGLLEHSGPVQTCAGIPLPLITVGGWVDPRVIVRLNLSTIPNFNSTIIIQEFTT